LQWQLFEVRRSNYVVITCCYFYK